MMVKELKAQQGTIICQVCEDVIAVVDSPEGVKTWYGVCTDCSAGDIKPVFNKQKLEEQRVIVKELEIQQGTIICQVCEDVIAIVDSPEGVKMWYGVCTDCSKEN